MQKMNPQDIKYGYIIVPKTLLTEQFTNCDTTKERLKPS